MRPAWLLAIRNWRAKPARSAGTLTAVALGVAAVVWVTSSFASVSAGLTDQIVERWVGRSHFSVEPPLGHWGSMSVEVATMLASRDDVAVVTSRLKRRVNLVVPAGADDASLTEYFVTRGRMEVDAVGIEAATEYAFRPLAVAGRRIEPTDETVALVDETTAAALGVTVGDDVALDRYEGGPSLRLRIVGLYEGKRVAKFQKPAIYLPIATLQQLTDEADRVTIVDAMLVHPDPAAIEALAEQLRRDFHERRWGHQVTTATARLNQLNEARRHTEFALILASSVALLTAFFIITTTLNMGLVERVTHLGALRRLGMTRGQIAGLVFAEVAPLGVLGSLLGVPLGLALTHAGVWVAPEYVSDIVVSGRGVVIAVVGGIGTTMAAAFLPVLHTARISPLAAVRATSTVPAESWPLVSTVAGSILVLVHVWMSHRVTVERWLDPSVTLFGVACLYVGYALMTPIAVRVLGHVAVQIVARMLLINPALLHDQVGRVAWRGAGICCGLMVGLSLMISVVTHSASVRAGWDFPKRLAEVFVWTRTPVSREKADAIRRLPGISECTVVYDFLCDVGDRKEGLFKVFNAKSTFVAGEPDVFLKMAKLEFLEGDYDDAYAKLKKGGYILVPPEASRSFGLHLGDSVSITALNRTATFEVAGVVQSPALDIAVTYFQADSYMMVAAAASVLGTLDDAARLFGADGVSLFLMNFALPVAPYPDTFAATGAPEVSDELLAQCLLDWGDRLWLHGDDLKRVTAAIHAWDGQSPVDRHLRGLLWPYVRSMEKTVETWNDATPRQRWDVFRDELLMRSVVEALDRPSAIFGSLRRLKQRIDDDIQQATILLAAIPVIALLVAGIGVGNLMMANVLSRTREIGILRAVGATRGQIMRLVLGEGLVLGVIGATAGVALGSHAAYTMILLTERAIGFAPEFQLPLYGVVAGFLLTIVVCIVAGISPARFAGRENIVSTMRSL